MWCLKHNIYEMQQRSENPCKICVADAGSLWSFDLTVFILSQWTQHLTLLPCVFFVCVINLSTDRHFLDESLNCSNPLS